MRCQLWVAAVVLAVGCDNPVQPRSGTLLTPLPTPAPLPAGGRIIEVGERVEGSVGWEDGPLVFRLTAPASGLLHVQVSWIFPLCATASYAINYNGLYSSGESTAEARFRVAAGGTYDFTVSNQNFCGWEPVFVLTTEIV